MKRFYILILLLASNALFAQELKVISSEEFIAANPSPERKAIVNLIVHQFDNYRKGGIALDAINNFWNRDKSTFLSKLAVSRVQIVSQKLYFDYARKDNIVTIRLEILAKKLLNILENYKIKDVDFILYDESTLVVEDNELERELVKNTLAFAFSKDLNNPLHKDKFLLPDLYLIDSGWLSLINRIEKANYNNLWQDKIDKVFWRGATTGPLKAINENNFNEFPRLNVAILSKLYPDLIDARISQYVEFTNPQFEKKFKSFIDYEPQVDLEESHLKYKYLLSMDGTNCAWKRVPWIMLSTSVLVKQETSKMEWFYPAIKPYVHYVPVNERLTDLFSQIEWMKSHDTELQKISQNAQSFVKNELMPEDIDAHIVLILNEYAKLHKGAKIVATLPSAEEALAKMEGLKRKSEEQKKLDESKKNKIKRFFVNIKEKLKNLWS